MPKNTNQMQSSLTEIRQAIALTIAIANPRRTFDIRHSYLACGNRAVEAKPITLAWPPTDHPENN